MEQTQKKNTSKPYSPEFRERAVRLLMEHRDAYQSDAARADGDRRQIGLFAGQSSRLVPSGPAQWRRKIGQTSEEKARVKQLERENRELRQANEILRKGEPVKAPLVQAHWRRRILHRRSSTARFANDRFH